MTSGYVRAEDQRAAEKLGIRRIIGKPSTLDQLGEALAEAIHSGEVPIAPSSVVVEVGCDPCEGIDST